MSPLVGVGHQLIVGKLYTELHQLAPTDLRVLPGCNVLRRSETDLHLKRQLYAQWKVGADTWLAEVDVSSIWPD